MNRFEFNTDLMRWELSEMGTSNFNIVGVSIVFTNQDYLNQCAQLLQSLNQKPFKIMVVNPNSTRNETYCLECVTFIGLNIPDGKIKPTPLTIDNVFIQGLIRVQRRGLPELNNMWLYILYE